MSNKPTPDMDELLAQLRVKYPNATSRNLRMLAAAEKTVMDSASHNRPRPNSPSMQMPSDSNATSEMATLIAQLREKFPNATPRNIKVLAIAQRVRELSALNDKQRQTEGQLTSEISELQTYLRKRFPRITESNLKTVALAELVGAWKEARDAIRKAADGRVKFPPIE